jgi:hypothetical protein
MGQAPTILAPRAFTNAYSSPSASAKLLHASSAGKARIEMNSGCGTEGSVALSEHQAVDRGDQDAAADQESST